MAKKPMKKRPPPPPASFSSSSDEEAPSPSIFSVKKLSASPSLKPADGEQEEEEESSEDSEYAAPKRSHQAAPRVSRNTANDLKLEKHSADHKTTRTVSMAEDDESSESEEEESTDEESSEDSENAVREPNPQTKRRDSRTANDGKHELANTSSSSDSGAEDGEEDGEELNSRSKSEQLLPPPPPKPARNAVNPIADPLLKIPTSAKSVDGGEDDKGLESEEEESTADESSEGFGNTVAKENTGPQPRDSQNLDDDKQASDTSSSSGSGLGDDEENIETPISDALLVPLTCKSIDSSVQPIEKEPNSGKQPAASPTQISKKKRTADIVGVVGGQKREHVRRIWYNDDVLALLQAILEYKEQHRIIPHTHMHAESLLKSVKDSLSISVSVNQINDKVRNLKRRYLNTSTRQNPAKKSKFSDPHNAAVFDLSKKIWDSLKEESILLEKKITLEKKENFNKKKLGLKHIEEEYPSLYWHLRSEHVNNALLLQNHIPIANAKRWEETCKKLEMIDVELNMQKIEFLSSAMKLIKDALAKC